MTPKYIAITPAVISQPVFRAVLLLAENTPQRMTIRPPYEAIDTGGNAVVPRALDCRAVKPAIAG
jgi:hypothetical protein